MEQNKTGKYLKYAIGEIVLVVIGILVALSINNWNEREKLKVEEQKLIGALTEEIESNIKKLESTISGNEFIIQKSNEFLKKVAADKKINIDVTNLSTLFAYNTNEIESSILNEILGTDSRALISNQNYILQLRDLKRSYSKCEKTQYYVDEYWNTQVISFFNKSGVGIYFTGNKLFNDKLFDFEITNTFLSTLTIMNGFQESLLMSREDLLEDLNETLEFLKNVNEFN
jgi:hypothetical protein